MTIKIRARSHSATLAGVGLIAWAMSCGLITELWAEADLTIFGIAGVSWGCSGFAYFAYLRKLRGDIDNLERRRAFRQSHIDARSADG